MKTIAARARATPRTSSGCTSGGAPCSTAASGRPPPRSRTSSGPGGRRGSPGPRWWAPNQAGSVQGAVDHGPHLRRRPRGLEVVEVEGGVQLVGSQVGGQCLVGVDPDLPDERPRRVVGVGDRAPLPPDLVNARLIPLRERHDLAERRVQSTALAGVRVSRGLDQTVGHVDAEPVDVPVEPEPQDVDEVLPHVGVVPVEVRLRGVEQVQVPPSARLPDPGRGWGPTQAPRTRCASRSAGWRPRPRPRTQW